VLAIALLTLIYWLQQDADPDAVQARTTAVDGLKIVLHNTFRPLDVFNEDLKGRLGLELMTGRDWPTRLVGLAQSLWTIILVALSIVAVRWRFRRD
jgi:hypothetical protein